MDSINFIGNVGAAVGSIVFSIVLGINCLAAFMGLGLLTLRNYLIFLNNIIIIFIVSHTK